MINSIGTLFLTSFFLFYFGYNAVFNTIETIEKYYKGRQDFGNFDSKDRIKWTKITGYVIILFSIILFSVSLYLIVKQVFIK